MLILILTTLVWLLGAATASLATCSASRLLIGQSIVSPTRSYCDHCHHPLCWWQLIPVVGWVVQRGHCHFCRHWIKPWSTVWEIIIGFSLVVLSNYELYRGLAALILLATLTFLATTDHLALVIFPLSLAGVLPIIIFLPWAFPQTISSFTICAFYSAFLFAINRWQHSLGLGDCQLLTLVLFLVGPLIGSIVILLSCLLVLPRALSHQHPSPFVPAIALVLITLCNMVAFDPALMSWIWASRLV